MFCSLECLKQHTAALNLPILSNSQSWITCVRLTFSAPMVIDFWDIIYSLEISYYYNLVNQFPTFILLFEIQYNKESYRDNVFNLLFQEMLCYFYESSIILFWLHTGNFAIENSLNYYSTSKILSKLILDLYATNTDQFSTYFVSRNHTFTYTCQITFPFKILMSTCTWLSFYLTREHSYIKLKIYCNRYLYLT